MWETFISWYINNYLGKYVENLNSQQLSFALRQGELELENVPLKKNIFRSWGLPIEVLSGVVGKIRIEFNILKYFRNEPVLVFIEDIYLVAGPLKLSEWDPMDEEILCNEAKMNALDEHEARWKAHNDLAANSSSYYSSLYFSSMRIGASIVTKVVENLQLKVRNVHIRYEEDIGDSKNRVMAFGITLESLTAQSCDSNWNPLSSVNDNTFECSYKTLQLNKFGMYCDTKAERFSHYKPTELKEMMRKLTSHEYILCPVSAEARIAKHNSPNPLPNSSKARFDVHLTLEKVPLNLTDSQFRQSYIAFKSFKKLERNCRLRHYRPFEPVKTNSRDWWQYAVRAVLSIRGYKRKKILKTWEEVVTRGKDNVAYVNAYEQHLRRELLSSDVKKLKDRIEMELHYDEIIILREVAIGRVELLNSGLPPTNISTNSSSTTQNVSNSVPIKTENSDNNLNTSPPINEAGQSQGIVSWLFPSWSGWLSSGAAGSVEADTLSSQGNSNNEKNLDDEFSPGKSSSVLSESKLHQSEIDFDEAILDDMKAFGRDALLARFHFVLKQGSVNLKKKTGPFLDLEFTGVDLRTELRPRSGAHKFQMTLASVFLKDCATKSCIISPHTQTIGVKPGVGLPTTAKEILEPLFRLSYERKPQVKTAHRVSVTTKPLDLVLYPILWEDLVRYFTVNVKQDDLESPHDGYEAMKQRTKEEIQKYMEKIINQHQGNSLGGGMPSWDIIMNISAPQIRFHGAKESRSNIKKIYSRSDGNNTNSGTSYRTSSSTSTSSSSGKEVEPFLVIDLGRFRFTNLSESESELLLMEEEKEHSSSNNSSINNSKNTCTSDKNFMCDSNNPIFHDDNNSYSDNEEFLTPCSSPVPEKDVASPQSCANSPRPSISDLSESATIKSPNEDHDDFADSFGDLQAKLYKKYRLEITDVQVIVVEGKSASTGNWRSAVQRGTSPLHLVDKFSINLQLERRLIYSEDPLWPALTLVATLPKWNLHFNETKILTMRSVLSSFFSSTKSKLKEGEDLEKLRQSLFSGSQISLQDDSMLGGNHSFNIGGGIGDTSRIDGETNNTKHNIDSLRKKSDSKLFLAQFTIQNVTVEIQSRGRSIAELQIIGARTSFTARPLDTSISFVIQSLLLADAVQTFGPDFELLLASHKHVSMDSVSGSLRDSDPASPMSPQSPVCHSPAPYANSYSYSRGFPNHLTIPSQLHDALVTSLQTKRTQKPKLPQHSNIYAYDSHTPNMDIDALITAELVLDNTEEDLAILSVQFNNLDLIANQETVLEILQFLQRAFPSSPSTNENSSMHFQQQQQQVQKSESKLINTGRYKLQTSFDFHRLNILLVRGVIGKDGQQCARKIATATASEARVNLTIHNNGDVVIDGSLGGLQMLNLTPEGKNHQRILSVGQDPLVDSTYSVFSHVHPSSVITEDVLSNSNVSALTFSFEKPADENSSGNTGCKDGTPIFKLRMASVIYTHCPMFLIDLKKCISEFQAPLATKLRSAAAQIALGLVRQDGSMDIRQSSYRSPMGSLSGSLDRLNMEDEPCGNTQQQQQQNSEGLQQQQNGENCSQSNKPVVELDIILDSPVIVLPKTRNSPEVLVANLGQITVSGNNREKEKINTGTTTTTTGMNDNDDNNMTNSMKGSPRFSKTSPIVTDHDKDNEKDGINYNVFVCDISLYSLDLTEKWSMMENLKFTFPTTNTTSIMTAQELYYCDPATSKPILHNTVIQFNICYKEDPPFVNALSDDLNNMMHVDDSERDSYFGPKLELEGRVVNPLKVSLTPKQYSQILDSLNNIAGGSEEFHSNELNLDTHANQEAARLRWKREVYATHLGGRRPYPSGGSGHLHGPVILPLPSPTRSTDDSLPIFTRFELPELIVELVLPESISEMHSQRHHHHHGHHSKRRRSKHQRKVKKEEPHLSLSCSDLSLECDKQGYITEMRLSLKSLTLEDTSVPENSPQRFLAMSNTSLRPDESHNSLDNSGTFDVNNVTTSVFETRNRNFYVSASCPDIPKSIPIGIPETTDSTYFPRTSSIYVRSESSSLPDHLDPSDIFTGRFFVGRSNGSRSMCSNKRKRRISVFSRSINENDTENKSCEFYPATPPPSPRANVNTNNNNPNSSHLGADNSKFVNLVQIQLCLVDSKSPNFITKYHGTHKFVDVDFNALEILLTPETFTCLRLFFSEANKYETNKTNITSTTTTFNNPEEDLSKDKNTTTIPEYTYGNLKGTTSSTRITFEPEFEKPNFTVDEEKNTETKINVKALNVKIATIKGTLAEGKVTNVMCNFVNRGKDFFGVEGRLGSLQIKDVSPHAGKYPVKFTFQGKQALDFDYYRKEVDAKFRLQMSSVVCVHTNRFYTEFSALISSLFGSLSTPGNNSDQNNSKDNERNNLQSQQQQQQEIAENKVRVSLDIQAGAPVLLFPYSATSRNLLVADLGHLSVRNKIVEEPPQIICDRISVDLIEMDLFAAELQYYNNTSHLHHLSKEKTERKSSFDNNTQEELGEKSQNQQQQKFWILDKKSAVVKSAESTSFLKEKCALKLKVRRILSGSEKEIVSSQAATSVEGTLSTVCCFLDPGKYKLIRGLLEFNIGEKLDEDDLIYSHLPGTPTPVRNRKSSFTTNPTREGSLMSTSKKELSIELDLVNVTLELVKEGGHPLSRVDFIKSKFTFHNYSDGTRDVDLASQEILICDSRFKDKAPGTEHMYSSYHSTTFNDPSIAVNIFTNILQQSTTMGSGSFNNAASSSASSSSQYNNKNHHHNPPTSFQSSTYLQAEIHYRLTQRGSSTTIVLNNMRLMLILDWWMELRSFLSQKGPTPDSIIVKDDKDLDEASTHNNLGEDGKSTEVINIPGSPLIKRSRRVTSPVTVSAGIVTKRAPILDVPDTTFELKVNVSNCELVVVEDPSVWDTSAIILKSTAVLNYKPHLERPVTCSLLQCELFSCILGLESETALSILDPTDITFELVRKTKFETQGIMDATLSPSNTAKILKVQSPHLSLRLSYYDMKMFVQLMERFSKQAQYHLLQASDSLDLSASEESQAAAALKKSKLQRGLSFSFEETSVQQLISMGFTRQESEEALLACDGRLDDAALCLIGNVKSLEFAESTANNTIPLITTTSANIPDDTSSVLSDEISVASIGAASTDNNNKNTSMDSQQPGQQLSGIEIKCSFLSLCVIDDCKDADVPLLELSVNQLELVQNCIDNSGQAECLLGGDYFNRELSGWEPFLEQWKCSVSWKKNDIGQLGNYSPGSEFPSKAPQYELSVSSRQVMNINVTSTLLNLYKTVSSNWSEEFNKQKVDRRRCPFVPFLLKNETGSELWFSTIVPDIEELIKQQRNLSIGTHSWNTNITSFTGDNTGWIHVSHGGCHPFSFEGRGKLRHRNSHQLRTHQLAVRVDGWQEIIPVSLDKVGTYFRVAKPAVISSGYGSVPDLPFTRLVFEVTLQGSAQKHVCVRSALSLKNSLNEPIELKLENTIVYPSFAKEQTGGSFVTQIKPGESYPIPLHSVWAQLWVRPTSEIPLPEGISRPSPNRPSLYRYCENHLLSSTDDNNLRSCDSLAENQLEPYRFAVAVQKDEFPADEDDLYRIPMLMGPIGSTAKAQMLNAAAQYLQMSKKVNMITLLSPLNIINLLPVEIFYDIKGKNIKERISPGKESNLTNVNTAGQVEIFFHLENFPHGSSINVSANNSGYTTRLKVMDSQKRPLILTCRVTKTEGNSISVYLSCSYWIVNKTGIPILCKQEGTSDEAAGQFQEHEMGRMVAPLLFSFPDQEGASALTLRVGTKLHPDSRTHWCRSLYLQNGMQVRKLSVSVPSPRTEIVYLVGIEIKSGRGRYRDCKLVTIAPRFTIDNRSSHEVQISQKHLVTSFFDPEAESTYLKLTPGCNLPFHWPRLDKDQLLCVRLADAKGSLWSGGFPIEHVDSFHIPVRHWDGACIFLRVEIIIQGPTYFIVLGDTDKLPPPFRVDNLSFVSIIFHQTAVGDERLKLTAKPESCCPFSWDEPTQPPHLTLAAPGGTSVLVNMDALGFACHLTYENFFYIAFTATFPSDESARTPVVGTESLLLVLDVEGTKVVLRRKEPGKRSQLWRVNADGLIEHEGSSAPREPRKPPPSYGSILVLDIAGSGPQPTQYTPLMLRKPDKRRASTQHWEFSTDGRLKCEKLDNLYVQAKDGFGIPPSTAQNSSGQTNSATWNQWNDVVLGPDQPICYSRTETGIQAEQAICKQKLRPGSGRLALSVDTDGPTRVLRIIDTEKPPRSKMLHHEFEENDYNTVSKLLANIHLKNGLGISIINCKPREELIYIRLTSMNLKYSDSKESQIVEISVDDFQIDNQLLEAEKPLAVYVIPTPRYEMNEFSAPPTPALQLSWQRMKSNLNAQVFKNWELGIKPLSVILEERLLLKLCHWIGLSEKFQSMEGLQESDFEVQKALTNATSLTARRFYFGDLTITLNQVRLSVLTTSKLSSDLANIKRRLGLTLIRFEDAQVELDPFAKQHPFETFEFLFASLVKHYRDELLSQAAIILGSTDFLGNPLGFVNDVSVGVTGLIYEGSLGSLVKNVTHGLSNSAAKVTGSLGDGLGRTTLDDRHEEERRKIREDYSGSSGEHLVAGIKGLAHGIIGGFTSIVAQSFEGATTDGLQGFVAGMGKGIVGTVTKPAVGILDLATGTAAAIRDSSRTSSRMMPERCRPPRVAVGNGGLLPLYSEMASRGQELLYEVNDRNYKELFIGHETLLSGPGRDLRVLVSSQAVIVFKPSKGNPIILKVPMSELTESRLVVLADKKICIELVHRSPDHRGGPGQLNRPQISCENENVARRVVEQINYAKVLYEEVRHSQIEKPTSPTDY